MNADGRVIVGSAGGRAYRWHESTGFADLRDLPAGAGTYSVFGVSDDGRVVMGRCAGACASADQRRA